VILLRVPEINARLPTTTRIISAMTFGTSGRHQVDGMAIAAGGAFMVNAIPVTTARVGSFITGRQPCKSSVALAAGCIEEQPGMERRIGVAGPTDSGHTHEIIIQMAACAEQPGVRPGQREFRTGMVKGGREPGSGGVAGFATSPKLALMLIVFLVTANTGNGEGCKNAIQVTFRTFQPDMRAGQWEVRERMIERNRQPGARRMALVASAPKLAHVVIILRMTGGTNQWGSFKVGDAASPGVTAATIHQLVFPGQPEGNDRVVESVAIAVDAIVTGQAGRTECLLVGLHERCFDLRMAGCANSLVEFGIAGHVTGAALIGGPVCLFLVGGQGETEDFMGDNYFRQVGQRGVRAAVVGMAVPAGHSRIVQVQRDRVLPLCDDIFMADYASVGHACLLPESRMTG
jgi:hypothetical protein